MVQRLRDRGCNGLGSYEGPLPVEGNPVRRKHRLSRDGVESELGGSFPSPLSREGGIPVERNERRQGCQWLAASYRTREDNARARSTRPAEAVSDVVKRLVPRTCRRGALDSAGALRAAKAAAASRERARCGCTQIVRVAEIGRTHHASFRRNEASLEEARRPA